VCPDHHFLESWGDAEPVAGFLSLQQPTIAPLYETRSFAETLLRWMDDPTDHYSYLRDFWRTQIMPRQSALTTFDAFWDHSLERGLLDLGAPANPAADAGGGDWKGAIAALRDDAQKAGGDKFELALFESVGLRDGSDGNNPWLLEMPDPISKVSWGNVAEIAPQTAKKLGVSDGDIISLASGGTTIEAPVFIQPGQHPRSISLATGYGRSSVGKAGKTWTGVAHIQGKFLKPAWSPPEEIRRDKPSLPDVIPGGTPENPMGVAAMTLNPGEFAIHGTNAPNSIGHFASYGCIRMHNHDIMDLYQRVDVGTAVVVLR